MHFLSFLKQLRWATSLLLTESSCFDVSWLFYLCFLVTGVVFWLSINFASLLCDVCLSGQRSARRGAELPVAVLAGIVTTHPHPARIEEWNVGFRQPTTKFQPTWARTEPQSQLSYPQMNLLRLSRPNMYQQLQPKRKTNIESYRNWIREFPLVRNDTWRHLLGDYYVGIQSSGSTKLATVGLTRAKATK